MNRLTPRLEAALALIRPAELLADVGADHGFLAIEAVRRGIVRRAVAIDDKSAPLATAVEHIAAAGLGDRVTPLFASGLPHEVAADAVAILGLGGRAIVAILSAADLSAVKRLVLSPHSEAAAVRGWLATNGFAIDAETFLLERGKHYQILAAGRGKMTLSAAERAYGPLILKEKNATFRAFVAARLGALETALAATRDPAKKAELTRRLDALKELIS